MCDQARSQHNGLNAPFCGTFFEACLLDFRLPKGDQCPPLQTLRISPITRVLKIDAVCLRIIMGDTKVSRQHAAASLDAPR